MEILGIGFPELVFILIVALIVMGPKDMEKAGRTLAQWLNAIVKSPSWRAVRDVTKEIQNMPTRWMREANFKEMEEINRVGKDINSTMTTLDKKYPPKVQPLPSLSRAQNPSPQPGGSANAPVIIDSPADESDPKQDA